MRNIIFDLDLTLVDTTVVEQARHERNWALAYSLIPQCVLYDGIEHVFEIIRKFKINTAIVSTSPRLYVEKVIQHFNIPVENIVAYHDAKPIKPHPAPMLKALELMGVSAKDTISFGDRVIDFGGDWPRVTFRELILKYSDIDIEVDNTKEKERVLQLFFIF